MKKKRNRRRVEKKKKEQQQKRSIYRQQTYTIIVHGTTAVRVTYSTNRQESTTI
jgi:hypothetical protein